jgi:DNA-binding MarR family transcriptional regulator
MRVLWAVDHGLQSGSKRMARTLGVTGPQRLVVRIIGKQPGLSAGTLARVLHVHPSTLTGVLRRLEERGAVERRNAEDDGRRVELYLTPRGRRINRVQVGTVESMIRQTLLRLEPRQIASTAEVLAAIAQALAD